MVTNGGCCIPDNLTQRVVRSHECNIPEKKETCCDFLPSKSGLNHILDPVINIQTLYDGYLRFSNYLLYEGKCSILHVSHYYIEMKPPR